MTVSTEIIPLLVVVLLLLSASGGDVERMEVVFEGTHPVTAVDDALVVGGGEVTVPAGTTVEGQLYVIGGALVVDGRVRGDVTVLSGTASVTDGAVVTGRLDAVAGGATVADGATVGDLRRVEPTPAGRSPAVRYGFLAAQALALAALTAWLSRRRPRALATVGDSVVNHGLVSGVVGLLAGATLLVLFVYMAFTLILLPVSVLGLAGLVVVLGYSFAVYGYLLGRRLPVERVDAASALGAAVFLLALELLGTVPVLGALVQFALVGVGFGAVLLTYFGLHEFEPARIPE
ncbi:polymer-forming cytoskeletal protein [Halobium salinum]|uniref:Polymer-forming cytoskeletal protein n=1 Tax=Halobium salinum TaxID=1364940 RepID=A0ABD5PF73_9EURY|nr:polymer-forming cytoskeletal protein [Halobium salinum]